ncbi:cellulose binding domain-containing protein [Actinoplanes sp. NPDC049681]|uniref:cellulose binding domain-containing protein n=1 Tax=Actinoplanes sp. NPDC049681 TaxID=3363905 RepID=UPI0037986F1B
MTGNLAAAHNTRAKGSPLSGKHTPGQFGLPRYSFIAAAATLLVILVAWVAVRATGPGYDQAPVLIVPPSSPVADAGYALPSTIPVVAPSPVVSSTSSRPVRPSATRKSVAPTSAVPKKPERTPTPARTASFTATYRTGATWDRGFIGAVQVTNTGRTAHDWRVSVTYPSRARVAVTNVWNAQVTHAGDTWTFTAADLAPGATAAFGFQATQQSRDGARPTGCVVNGTPCRIG